MKPHEKSLQRLIETARRAPESTGDLSAPYGFSTRVAALAMERPSPSASVFARMSLRAAGVACLLATATVALSYSAIASALNEDTTVAAPASQAALSAPTTQAASASTDDPVGEVLNAATT
jgi:hypothetical protein